MENNTSSIRKQIFALENMSTDDLRMKWLELYKSNPKVFKRGFLIKGLAYKIQSLAGLDEVSEEEVDLAYQMAKERLKHNTIASWNNKNIKKEVVILPPAGSVIKKQHKDKEYIVKILDENKFSYNGAIYNSLSAIAMAITGTRWSGYAFFNLKKKMTTNLQQSKVRCAIYTRKSSEEGLELEYNSLDNQYDSCKKYIESQKLEGWVLNNRPVPHTYLDFSITQL